MSISAKTAFDIGSKAVLPAWLAVSLFPGHQVTERLVEAAVLTNAAIYVYSGMNGSMPEGGGFNSLRQVTTLFRGGNDYLCKCIFTLKSTALRCAMAKFDRC